MASPVPGGKERKGDESIKTKLKITEKKIFQERTFFFHQKKLFVTVCKNIFKIFFKLNNLLRHPNRASVIEERKTNSVLKKSGLNSWQGDTN